MNKEIADKWVEALRSGKYKQGTGSLCEITHSGEHYCCLGVLCDIANIPYTIGSAPFKTYDGDKIGLSLGIMKKVGMESSLGRFRTINNGIQFDLSKLNDGGRSFKEIADVIEQNWEAL